MRCKICGLVGITGNITIKDVNAFKEMLVLDSVRGYDSVGVFSLTKKGEESLVKSIDAVANALETKKFIRALTGDFKLLMGHNRAASVGNVNINNAHPFDFENIVGAHNGTLTGWKYNFEDAKQFDVDSESLFHNINKRGIEATYKKAEGAMALTWFDRTDNSVNLLRNNDRPLYIGFNKEKDVTYWASEPWMMSVALAHQGLEVYDIVKLEPHTLMKIVGKEVATKVFTPFQRAVGNWTGNTGNSGNVISYRGGNTYSKSSNALYIQGDEIEFEVIRCTSANPSNKNINIVCRDVCKPYTEFSFWVHKEMDAALLDVLSESVNTFTAIVSSCFGGQIRIMNNTIKELKAVEESSTLPFTKAH